MNNLKLISQSIESKLQTADTLASVGRVTEIRGLLIESRGPDCFIGEHCELNGGKGQAITAKVVGFRDGRVVLMPLGDINGVRVGSIVRGLGVSEQVMVGDALLGRVVDALGNPLDEDDQIPGLTHYQPATFINPLHRAPVTEIFETGVKGIDSFLTLGYGQRIGLFAGSGVGKSTLLQMLFNGADTDVNVVALIGERGREVMEFVHSMAGTPEFKKTVVVAATADQSALLRAQAASYATALAEYFAASGKRVMLAVDSMTRYAMALREIGLAAGEPAATRGYTPSVFAKLPTLVERAGNFKGKGSITGIYTVLVEGDDENEPVTDHLRAILDGHIMLSRRIANEGNFPAIDLLKSISRLQQELCTDSEKKRVMAAREQLALHEEYRDMITVGAYEKGRNPSVDWALDVHEKIKQFARQMPSERVERHHAMEQLKKLMEQT